MKSKRLIKAVVAMMCTLCVFAASAPSAFAAVALYTGGIPHLVVPESFDTPPEEEETDMPTIVEQVSPILPEISPIPY